MNGSEERPPRVAEYLASGYARPGELLAWWRNRRGEWCVLVRYQGAPDTRFELGVFPETVGSWADQLNGATLDTAALARALETGGDLYDTDWRSAPGIEAILRQALQDHRDDTRPPGRTALFALDAARFEAGYLFLPHDAAGAPDLLWERCRNECAGVAHTIQAVDTFFADLDANPPDRSALTGDESVAADTFRKTVDVAARHRGALPWWLEAAGRMGGAGVGLLSPPEVRLVARHAGALRRWLAALDDADALLARVEAAAARGDWVVGWEPGT